MDYTTYLTSEHLKPKLMAVVNGLTQPLNDLMSMNLDLNVNTASGYMLDIIGSWVGVSRRLQIPLDVLAQYDNTSRGWDSEYVWFSNVQQPSSSFTILSDNQFRQLIQVTIVKNYYDGTAITAYMAMEAFKNTVLLGFIDNGDMSVTVIVDNNTTDPVIKQLLTNGTLNFMPFGVKVKGYETNNVGLIFAWDIENNPLFAGWDGGRWGNTLT
jgi:Protein of unknown function (DUF2612)